MLASLALTFLPLGTGSAWGEPSQANSIHAGAVSLQLLTFGGGGFLSPRDGISVKAHFSDRGAVLLGASLALDESSGKSAPSQPLYISNSRYYTVTISSEIQEYIDARGPVTMFLALGPYWSRSRSFYERTQERSLFGLPPHADSYRDEQKSWQVGVRGGVGFEWFFKRKLSVLGRVGASLAFGKGHDDSFTAYDLSDPSTYSSHHTDSSSFTSTSSSSALGLAAYF